MLTENNTRMHRSHGASELKVDTQVLPRRAGLLILMLRDVVEHPLGTFVEASTASIELIYNRWVGEWGVKE